MARLFIGPREQRFIDDITKELIKDVVGQVILVYPINEIKTSSDGVYNESTKKVFDNPIRLDCLVDTNFQQETKIDANGPDANYKVEVYVQYRDLVDKNVALAIGDFFSYGSYMYEITEKVFMGTIYGEVEYKNGVKLIGIKSRHMLFDSKVIGPTDIARPEPDAVQTTFVQQRGQAVNAEGPTGDVRALQDPAIVGPPITGAKEVSPKGDTDGTGISSFYDEDDA